MSCGCSGSANETFVPEDVSSMINNHPCYSEGAHHHYARIHLSVAPACNIQCHYCNRKYDCSNESRPGVTTERLTPEEGAKKVLYVGSKIPQLSVVGIAGPGDALANPKKTFETFDLINKYAPDLRLCVSTNGLSLPHYVDELERVGVDHITVTINAVTPEVGAKIYPWIYDTITKKRYRGVEAAEILLNRQLQGIKACVERGILIKANSVLIPGVNEEELVKVSKKLKEMGVFLHNIMPLLSSPEFGTYYGLNGYPSATDEQLMAAQEACGMDMKLMTHCRQCRADAVGLLGEDRSDEFTKETFTRYSFEELVEMYNVEKRKEAHENIENFRKHLDAANKRVADEKAEISSTGETILVAVTSMGSELVNAHFGTVTEFLIYEAGDQGTKFRMHRKIEAAYCNGPDSCSNPMEDIKERLKDCTLLLTAKIGQCPQDELASINLISDETYADQPIELAVVSAAKKYFEARGEKEEG